jgi:hypothetical protein
MNFDRGPSRHGAFDCRPEGQLRSPLPLGNPYILSMVASFSPSGYPPPVAHRPPCVPHVPTMVLQADKLLVRYQRPEFLRQRLVCSALSSRPVLITKIREEDEAPGMKGTGCPHQQTLFQCCLHFGKHGSVMYGWQDRAPGCGGGGGGWRGATDPPCTCVLRSLPPQSSRLRLRHCSTSSATAPAPTLTKPVRGLAPVPVGGHSSRGACAGHRSSDCCAATSCSPPP